MDTISHNRNNVTSRRQVNRLKSVYGRRQKDLSSELLAKQIALQIYDSEGLKVLNTLPGVITIHMAPEGTPPPTSVRPYYHDIDPERCTANLLHHALKISGILK